jgi:hypothetical protein
MASDFDAILVERFFVFVSYAPVWRWHIHMCIPFDCISGKMAGYLNILP